MEKFEMILEKHASKPFHRVAEAFYKSGRLVDYKIDNHNLIVSGFNLSPNNVLSLGISYCHVSYNWNWKIEERIKQRDCKLPQK
jgi:hypothetical protein